MDKKRIIEEGLLEQYLLGELSMDEHAAISKIIEEDDDLRLQYNLMEAHFEKMAFENAVEPPPTVKEFLIQKIESQSTDTPIRKLNTQAKNKTLTARLMVAASLAALFALSSFWFYNQWKETEQNLQLLQQQTTDLQIQMNDIEKNYVETNAKYQIINNPDVIPLVLESKQTKAIAYVNHRTKQVALNPQGLPKLESDKTYQMWADVDGEMISMGIVPTDTELVSLTYIDDAESLNITIEPAGGNDHATVENLVSNVIL